MKNIIITSIMLLACTLCYGQEATKNFRFIIAIDDNIQKEEQLRFLTLGNAPDSTYQVSYYPGNLSIAQLDYDKLMSDSTVETVILSFYYSGFCNKKNYKYKIEMHKSFLNEIYVKLGIFNLNKRKNRKKYSLCAKRNRSKYFYKIEHPNGTVVTFPDNILMH